MPAIAAGAAVAAAINAGVTSLIAAQIIYAATYVIVSAAAALAMSYIGNALFGTKPQTSGASSLASDRSQMVRQAITPRKIIYGKVKTSGPLTFLHVSSDNRYCYLLVTLTGHPIEAIDEVWFGDEKVETYAAPAWSAQAYNAGAYVRAGSTYYQRTSAAYPTETVCDQYDDNGTCVSSHTSTIVNQAPASAPSLWTAVSDPSSITGTREVGGDYAGYAWICTGLGTDATDAALLAQMRADVPSLWTADHRQRGCAKIYVKLKWNSDVFTSGIPNIAVVLRGKNDIYDPRTETTGYTSNWALCVADYLTMSREDGGVGSTWADVGDEDLIASANVCDEAVALASGGTEARYQANGIVNTEDAPKSIIESLLTAGAGSVVWSGGKWRIFAGYYRTPESQVITDDMLVGPVRVQTRRSRSDLYNSVRGTFISPENDWEESDLPVLKSAAYIAEDSGEAVYADIEYGFTTSATAGQRLMKIALLRCRQQIAVTLQCNLAAMRYRAGDNVRLTRPTFGWDEKVFEVTSWTLVPRDDGTIGIDLGLQETDASVWDWSTSEEQSVDPAPNTNLPRPWTVARPSVPSLLEEKYVTTSGSGVKVRAVISWGASTTANLRGYRFEISPHGANAWTVYPDTTATTLTINDIAPGSYDTRVKAINSLGAMSEYAEAIGVMVYGLLDTPAAISGLTISSAGILAVLRWEQSADLDVRIGGSIEFRHSATANEFAALSIGEAVSGSSTVTVLPLKPGFYWARPVDSSGTPGPWASVSTSASTVLEYVEAASYTEDVGTGFPGAGASVYEAPDGTLRLAGTMLVSEAPLVSTWPSVAALGGIAASGTYGLGAGLDFTVPHRYRLTATVDALSINVADRIGARGLVSAWPSVSAAASGMTDVTVWFRETDDDPSATPEWTEWQRLDVAEVFTRAVQAQARLTTSDPTYSPAISSISLKAEALL